MLTAYAIPEKDDDGSDYSYVWTLVGNTLGDKDDKGTMDDADKQQLKLSNLKAGTPHMNWTEYLCPVWARPCIGRLISVPTQLIKAGLATKGTMCPL